MSSNQILAYKALRNTLPPSAAKWFATHRKFAVANRKLLPAIVYASPVKSNA